MYFKRYTLASLILIGAVGAYVHYMVTKGSFTLEFFGVNVALPIAVWIMIPMILLYLASFFHMLYFGFKGYLHQKRVTRDMEKLIDALYWDILKAPKQHAYNDKQISKIGIVLDAGCDNIAQINIHKCDNRIKEALEIVDRINNDEYVDLKKIVLDKSNPLMIHNMLNMLLAEPNKAEEILRKSESYDKTVVNKAAEIFVESANEQQLEKYKDFINVDILLHLLNSMKKDENHRISIETIKKLLDQKNPSEQNYLEMARRMSKLYTPDELLRFFEKISSKDEKAYKAYLFILIEFEMLDRASELLQDASKDEYRSFRAFIDLRRAGKHYPIDLLLQRC